MLVRPDGVGLSEVRVLIRADNGAIVMGEYGGVVDFGADGYEALAKGRGPARAAVQLAPRYLTCSRLPKLAQPLAVHRPWPRHHGDTAGRIRPLRHALART